MNHATMPLAEIERQLKVPSVDPDCTGPGNCHGCLKWCNVCGDVDDVCDDRTCDAHAPCDTCGRPWQTCDAGTAEDCGAASEQAFLAAAAKDCRNCSSCADIPCGACQQGAPCDAWDCTCDDRATEEPQSMDDLDAEGEAP